MSDRERRFLEVVQALMAEPVEAQLVALGDAGAALAMPDGSFATVLSLDHGTPEEIVDTWRSLIANNPTHGFKLVLVGGTAEHHALLRELQPAVMMRRVIQVFALADDGTPWAGSRSRLDSPTGRVLAEIGARPPKDVDRDALRVRIARPDPEDRKRAEEARGFVDTVRRGVPRVTIALLASYVVAFALEMLWGGAESTPTLVRMGANVPAETWDQPWDLLASAWLHAGIVHLAFNGFALWVLGSFFERLLGSSRLVVIYVLSALGGGLASALVARALLSVGASGAICGLLGAAVALAWRPAGIIPPSVLPVIRRNALVNLVVCVVISFLPVVDGMAHLGGALVGGGLVLSGVITRGVGASTGPSRVMQLGAALCGAVFVAAFATAVVRERPWELAAPGAMVEREVVGVKITVPEILVGRELESDDGERIVVFGDLLRDPLVIAVIVEEVQNPSTRVIELEKFRKANPPWPDPDMTVVGEREDDDTGELPAFRDQFRGERVEAMNWYQLHDRQRIVVRAIWWNEHPLAGKVAANAYASLRAVD